MTLQVSSSFAYLSSLLGNRFYSISCFFFTAFIDISPLKKQTHSFISCIISPTADVSCVSLHGFTVQWRGGERLGHLFCVLSIQRGSSFERATILIKSEAAEFFQCCKSELCVCEVREVN